MTVIGLIGLGRVGFRALKILINRKELFIKIFEKDPFKKSLVSEYENIEFVETRSFEDIERHRKGQVLASEGQGGVCSSDVKGGEDPRPRLQGVCRPGPRRRRGGEGGRGG